MDIFDSLMSTIHIKNMVCPRCIKVVKDLLAELGMEYADVTLGQAELKAEITPESFVALRNALAREGFELLDSSQAAQVENIRHHVIAWARMEGERPLLSDYLQEKCLKEYSAISKMFSQMTSVTVERYAMMQRIEYAKELISYGDRSFSEISWSLGFSSPAHFSNQFKKETGMSPKEFKSMHAQERISIDKL